MSFVLLITPKARKALDKIPEDHRKRVVDVLEDIESDPFAFKQLSGRMEGQYSARVWPYRVIFRVEKKKLLILVIDMGHRQGIYK